MMNDNLKSYSTTPDPMVWERINKTLIRRKTIRRSVIAACATAGIITTAILVWPSAPQAVSEETILAANNQTIVTPSEVAAVSMTENAQAPIRIEEAKATSVSNVSDEDMTYWNAEPFGEPYTEKSAVEDKSKPAEKIVQTESKTPVEVKSKAQEAPEKKPVESSVKNSEAPKASPASSTSDFMMPNIFAPESDIAEDRTFRAYPTGPIQNFKMMIFDRSGRQVYESSDVNQGWDGTFKGRKLPQAGYVYVISYRNMEGKALTKKGQVVLVR